jgi:3-oxoacyl-[acyl-carrier protein] reductase
MLPRFGTHALSVETRDGYTVAEIEAAGGIALGIEVDVRDPEAVEAGRTGVGSVDVLVANAEGGRGRPMDSRRSFL